MARELMLCCVEGGVGHDAYVAGKMKAGCLCGNGALMVLRL